MKDNELRMVDFNMNGVGGMKKRINYKGCCLCELSDTYVIGVSTCENEESEIRDVCGWIVWVGINEGCKGR